jgi:integrase
LVYEKTGNSTARIDRFAESLPADAPPDTLQYYRSYLGQLASRFGNRKASGLTGQEAALWQRKLAASYAPNSVNHAVACAKRLFNWAIDEAGLIPGPNPFARVKALQARNRERLMSRAEYRKLHEAAGPALRDVLVALRYTSARPGEVRSLEWRMVDWGRKLWVLPAHKTSRTSKAKAPRVIAFPPEVEEVLRRLSPEDEAAAGRAGRRATPAGRGQAAARQSAGAPLGRGGRRRPAAPPAPRGAPMNGDEAQHRGRGRPERRAGVTLACEPPGDDAARFVQDDPNLARVLDAWPALPAAIRRAVLALVESAR